MVKPSDERYIGRFEYIVLETALNEVQMPDLWVTYILIVQRLGRLQLKNGG